jgi:hypothetical protein
MAQAMVDHRAPDWKIHFSVTKQDVSRAFNLLAELFHAKKCKFGLKATVPSLYPPYDWDWPAHMRGREITLYIYTPYDPTSQHFVKYTKVNEFDDDKIAEFTVTDRVPHSQMNKYGYDTTSSNPFDDLQLPDHGHSWAFYRDFIRDAERILTEQNVQPNGCAIGDYPLGKYASLRNETFVMIDNKLIYPPNGCGYNGGECPDIKHELESWDTISSRIQDSILPNRDCSTTQIVTRVGGLLVSAAAIGTVIYWFGTKYSSSYHHFCLEK